MARAMLSSQQKDLKIRLLKVEVQRLDLAYRALGGQNVGDTLRESLTERIRPLFKRRRGAPVRNDSPSGIMKSLRERFGIDIIDSFELLRCEAAASLGIEKASDKEALRFFVRRHYFDGVMNLSST
ncbi:MAG: hypothetical protein HYX63_23070 [Gammaproteobacteria bacterium]|nr:hypothetical protein [Gammaproteobacteria bacterium]